MTVPSKHIFQQGPVIAGLAKTAVAAVKQKYGPPRAMPPMPGPVFRRTIAARDARLVADYVRHVGGNPREYRDHLPPHFFPQWGFPLSMRTLTDLPYPLMRVLNGGCRIENHARLPTDEPLEASAQLVDIDDNGRRAVLHQKVVTGASAAPAALVGHFYVVVPLGGGDSGGESSGKPRVPAGATEVARWSIPTDAGLDFSKLTGDFNPVHWVPLQARAMGFDNVILQGFSTMARAYEGLHQTRFKGGEELEVFDVKFTRPLVLPADVGLYVDRDNGVFVGDAPAGPAYMVGSYELKRGNGNDV